MSNDPIYAKYVDLDKLILRNPHFKHEFFPYYEQREEFKEMFFTQLQILVVGAGGIGCEILKDLALSGFLDIHVIDMDQIDVTNLNRQFLFRQSDVGDYKARVAAKFIEKRVKGVKVTPYIGKIQDQPNSFWASFPVIIAGLDNIEARNYINLKVHQLVEYDENQEIVPGSQKIFIDGGSEGFRGQARVIIPYKTSCYNCTIETMVKENSYPVCTVKNTPRQPEHCIIYVIQFMFDKQSELYASWQESFGEKLELNKDSKEEMSWVYEKSLERAKEFDINGITYELTIGVVKNIIPAIASTNAIIAAASVNEALKGILSISQGMKNDYFMFMGQDGLFTQNQLFQRNPKCYICNRKY